MLLIPLPATKCVAHWVKDLYFWLNMSVYQVFQRPSAGNHVWYFSAHFDTQLLFICLIEYTENNKDNTACEKVMGHLNFVFSSFPASETYCNAKEQKYNSA